MQWIQVKSLSPSVSLKITMLPFSYDSFQRCFMHRLVNTYIFFSSFFTQWWHAGHSVLYPPTGCRGLVRPCKPLSCLTMMDG